MNRSVSDNNIDLPHRARGALLGLACGDAVGTTVEFEPRGSFVPMTDMVGGSPFDLVAGQWTDDTSMMLCLAPANEIAFAPHARLCFYPSSGDRALWVLMRLDCDLFVMADKWREAVSWRRIQADFKKQGLPIELVQQGEGHLCFRSQGKTAWIFIEDNNVTLARLQHARLTIHHFVGICDGCCEGGNHECVHERPFLSRVLPLADLGMAYTTDHSRPLERERPYYWGSDVSNHPRFVGMVAWRNFPEPPSYRRGLGPDLHERVRSSTRFELQGVLVAPHHGSHDRFKASDLMVLPKGNFPNQLDSLIPFRIQYGRGVLAEYRVFWERDWYDGSGRVGYI